MISSGGEALSNKFRREKAFLFWFYSNEMNFARQSEDVKLNAAYNEGF